MNFYDHPVYCVLSEHIIRTLTEYQQHGMPPGGFVTACLENNLCESFGRADHINKHVIGAIVSYMYNEMDSRCWGSKERVERWLEARE